MTKSASQKVVKEILYNNTRQLAIIMASCVVMLIILDAKGLVVWADRLESGYLQRIAQPVAHGLDTLVAPLGLSSWRQPALDRLQAIGTALAPAPSPSDTQETTSNSQNPSLATTQKSDISTVAPKTTKKSSITTASITTASSTVARVPLDTPVDETTLAAVPTHTPLPATLSDLNNKNPIHIAMAGDSMMAVGLSAQMQQDFAKQPNIKLLPAFKSGTGLSRPEVFNWLTAYPKMIGNTKPDLILVAIGANDAQDYEVNGKILHFGTPEWLAVYQSRLNDFVAMISPDQTPVIWMGLPAMKQPNFNKKVDLMNRLTYHTLRQYPQITWWNPNPYITNEQGEFSEFGKTASGQTVRFRASDGIHLTNESAEKLIPELFSWYQKTP